MNRTIELYGRTFEMVGVLQIHEERKDYMIRKVNEAACKYMEVETCSRMGDPFPPRYLTDKPESRVPSSEICPFLKKKMWWVSPKWRGAAWQMDTFISGQKLCLIIWKRRDAEIENPPFAGRYDDEDTFGNLTNKPPDPRLVQERYKPKAWHEIGERS